METPNQDMNIRYSTSIENEFRNKGNNWEAKTLDELIQKNTERITIYTKFLLITAEAEKV